MSTLIALLLCLPQDPTPAERLRAAQHEVVADEAVAAVESALLEVQDGRFPGMPTPPLVRELRRAGVDALDLGRSRIAGLAAQEDPVAALFTWVREAHGFRGRVEAVPARPSIADFEKVCSHGHRDLIQALGSGRDLALVAPELHAAVEQVRRNVQNLDELGAEEVELLRERLARIAKGEREVLHAIAERIALAALALDRDDFRDAMRRQPVKSGRSDGAVRGDVYLDRDTTFGRMVVGGFGRNSYDCSQIDVIVDLGGNDEYRGPAGGAGMLRRLAAVVDLGGDDVYEAGNDGLGSGTFGIGVLVDHGGNDQYRAEGRSAGFGLGGVGVLIDRAGDDRYELGDQSGGVGLAGTGVFADLAGNDLQSAGVQALGCGLPAGIGLFVDRAGDDVRELGLERKRVADSGEDAAGRTTDRDGPEQQKVSVGLGAGVGALPWVSPGLGVCVDLGGADRYQASGLACGVGIRGGVGLFIDAAGDDAYELGDIALGAAYAHGLGLFRDEGGDDRYRAGHLALGAASSHGLGLGCDLDGDDAYSALSPSFGAARRFSVGAFLDLAGQDRYELRQAAVAWDVLAQDDHRGAAIGMFVDLGAAEDGFSFDRFPSPENGRLRGVEGGTEDHPERWFFLDR
jgi:hypothetical protein